jgi:hypothetical protein
MAGEVQATIDPPGTVVVGRRERLRPVLLR